MIFYINAQLPSGTVKLASASDRGVLAIEITCINEIFVAGVYIPITLVELILLLA